MINDESELIVGCTPSCSHLENCLDEVDFNCLRLELVITCLSEQTSTVSLVFHAFFFFVCLFSSVLIFQDNVNVFLKACEKLGLNESQLFHPGDLQDISTRVTLR